MNEPSHSLLSKLAIALVAVLPIRSVAASSAPLSDTQHHVRAIVPGELWRDTDGNPIRGKAGCILRENSTFYWFGADRRRSPAKKTTFVRATCYASEDLMNWRFVKNILTPDSNAIFGPAYEVGGPKIIHNDKSGKYIMFIMNRGSDGADAVAILTSPTLLGDYQLLTKFTPLGNHSVDISLFKDTDDTAYLLSHRKQLKNGEIERSLAIYRLADDYLSVTEMTMEVKRRLEAPNMVKIGGRYFLFASQVSGFRPNDNVYMTATSMRGPWSPPEFFAPQGSNTYGSQIMPGIITVNGSNRTSYVYAGMRWVRPNLEDSPFVWLPLEIEGDDVSMKWYDAWSIDVKTGKWRSESR